MKKKKNWSTSKSIRLFHEVAKKCYLCIFFQACHTIFFLLKSLFWLDDDKIAATTHKKRRYNNERLHQNELSTNISCISVVCLFIHSLVLSQDCWRRKRKEKNEQWLNNPSKRKITHLKTHTKVKEPHFEVTQIHMTETEMLLRSTLKRSYSFVIQCSRTVSSTFECIKRTLNERKECSSVLCGF